MKRNAGYFSFIVVLISISCVAISNIESQSSNVEPTQTALVSPTESAPRVDWLTFIGDGDTTVHSIAQDSKGNIYVLTQNESDGNGHVDLFVTKTKQSGEMVWRTLIASAIINSNATLVIDQENNIYVASNTDKSWGSPLHPFNPDGYYQWDVFVAKINEDGSMLWNTFIGDNRESTMAIDKNNIIYILTLGGHDEDPVLVKLNSDGQVLSQKSLASSTSNYFYHYPILNIDEKGYLYASGSIEKGTNEIDLFVSKYSNDGEFIWETVVGGEGSQDSHYVGQTQIVLDNNGSVFLHGFSNASFGTPINPFDGGYDPKPNSTEYGYEDGYEDFIAKLDNDGNILWNTFLDKNTGIFDIGIREDGNLVIAGWKLNPNDLEKQKTDFAIYLMDTNGMIKSSLQLGLDGYTGIYKLIPSQYPNIFVAGSSNVSFGNPIIQMKNNSMLDIFLANIHMP